jgi:predicted acylesterase/phospholipase RssA
MPQTTAAGRPTAHPKMAPAAQKRLLALDGGGIRGILSLEILAEMERILRASVGGGRPEFRLADYFDYVAGTSTGAIIATCVSLGMSVDEIRKFYEDNGVAMFDKAGILKRAMYKYEDNKLADKLRDIFDTYQPPAERAAGQQHTQLGSAALRTLLLLVMRNATTDSPWPVSNNPWAKYNARDRDDCNLDLELWQLVRASTAAPSFFPPEEITIGQRRFIFVDGGLSTYNDPAFLLFTMATVGPYNLGWPAGADKMLLVSVGTGGAADENLRLRVENMHLLYTASSAPGALMHSAMDQQDTLCRMFGRCRAGSAIDREIGALLDDGAVADGALPKLFTYMRYTADLSREGLQALGVGHLDPEQVQKMDSVQFIPQLQEVGRAAARRDVKAEHFKGFV